MTRTPRIVAVVVLVSAPAALPAAEPWFSFLARPQRTAPYARLAERAPVVQFQLAPRLERPAPLWEVKLPSVAASQDDRSKTNPASPLSNTAASPPAASRRGFALGGLLAAAPAGKSQESSDNQKGFHPAIDCGDGCCLDRWCDCGAPRCRTDQSLDHPCRCSQGNCYQSGDQGDWVCNDLFCDVRGDPGRVADTAVRFGWWDVSTNGDLTKIGEYQDLEPSPFWDFDGLYSDGTTTYNLYATGTDREGTQAGLQYYGKLLKADVDFQRYLRRRDHLPLTNFQGASQFADVDLNVGEDYAIRVEELSASAETYLTKNIKFGVDIWGMRKFGERQANGMAHCFVVGPGPFDTACHVLSQRQRIDWLTMEIKPRVEAQFGKLAVEYSRPMRSFSQNDQAVVRDYTNPFNVPIMFAGTFPYALVPDNYTEIDQLKIGADLAQHTRLYGFGYYGRTTNKFRDVQRGFGGFDLRLTNHSVDGLTLTGYSKLYDQNGERPPFLLADETQNLTEQEAQERIRDPIEYRRTTAGLKGRWRPLRCHPLFGSLALTGGYEFDHLERRFALFESPEGDFIFRQPDTVRHILYAGAKTRLTHTLDSYVRYKVLFIDDPLYGFREQNGFLGSSLPEQRHLVEIGGTWSPRHNLMVTGHFEIDARRHFANSLVVPGNIVDFEEDSYPITATIWYAPTQRLSLTAGLAFLTSWIDQNITVGDEYVFPLAPITRRWNYSGQSSVISVSADYAYSSTLRLLGGYEFVRAHDSFSPTPVADLFPDLPLFSDVIVETQRLTAGLDWTPCEHWNAYFRYVYFDYEDESVGLNSGTAHMALAGVTLVR